MAPADDGLLAAGVDGADEAGIPKCSGDGAHGPEPGCGSDEIEEEEGKNREEPMMGFLGFLCHGLGIWIW